MEYRDADGGVRNPHPLSEMAAIDAEIAGLTARRAALQRLHEAAVELFNVHGYTRRQVRMMAGFDLSPPHEGPDDFTLPLSSRPDYDRDYNLGPKE